MNANALLLVVKSRCNEALETAAQMAAWLHSRGLGCRILESLTQPGTVLEAAHDVDAVLVLGGDGAILETARALCGQKVPLLGINYGRVGFLAEYEPCQWQQALEDLLQGALGRQSFCALSWTLRDASGHCQRQGFAVNDVVAGRGSVARTIALTLKVDGVLLSHCRCDGIVISSALGATGYAVSAGGPLLFPSIEACVITPLSPFAGAFPPVVAPAGAIIEKISPEGSEVYLTLDGQDILPLEQGQVLEVCARPHQVQLLARDPAWYLKRLNQRGFILPGPGAYRICALENNAENA